MLLTSMTKDLNLEQIQLVVRMRIKSWIESLMPLLLGLVVSLCIQGDLREVAKVIIKNVLACHKKCLKIFNNITYLKSILLKDEKHHLLHADAVPLFPK